MTYLDKLVDYTINTPHNTNAAIVKSLAERYAEEKAGGGSDILETVTISEPNIIYDGVLEKSGWSRLGVAWDYSPVPSEIAPFVDGGDYTVIFNGEAFKGTVENGSFDSEQNSNGQSFRINPGDGGYISAFSSLLDSAMDVSLQIINGTIERTETKVKQEYLPAMPLFVTIKGTADLNNTSNLGDSMVSCDTSFQTIKNALEQNRPIIFNICVSDNSDSTEAYVIKNANLLTSSVYLGEENGTPHIAVYFLKVDNQDTKTIGYSLSEDGSITKMEW